ncbi:MAG TPA: hypothetical protein DE027_07790 [Candidatus Marinimicrobia bacterium]|nr:hypothetical protein [Candidatus Neomarinimicrobiota bacterium]
MFEYWKDTSYRAQEEWAGENRHYGAIISFVVNANTDSVMVIVKRRKDEIIRRYNVAVEKGVIQRMVWDLKHSPPSFKKNEKVTEGLVKPKPEDIFPRPAQSLDPEGPSVSPGVYTVSVIAGDHYSEQSIRVNPDPLLNIKLGDYRQREKFLLKVMAMHEAAYALNENLQSEIDTLKKSLDEEDEKLKAVQAKQKKVNGVRSSAMRLGADLQGGGVRQGSFLLPTKTHRDRFARLQRSWNEMKGE